MYGTTCRSMQLRQSRCRNSRNSWISTLPINNISSALQHNRSLYLSDIRRSYTDIYLLVASNQESVHILLTKRMTSDHPPICDQTDGKNKHALDWHSIL
ncbi:unnamed protein product, partial [Dicrocoelium dendriticum]